MSEEEMTTIEVDFPANHNVMRARDHHVMTFVRAQADDTDLGCVKVRVPALDRLWHDAFVFGVQCGTALRKAADEGKKDESQQDTKEKA